MAKTPASLKLEPLKIKCTSADCDNDLHCFKATRAMKRNRNVGPCRSCGVKLVDWDRLHSRDVNDVEYTFKALKSELIRHHFWHVEIDDRAVAHARRKGVLKLREAVETRIDNSVGQANPPRDGRQTPFTGNSIYYAQHATATCCRKCMEYWHSIPMGTELTGEEIRYFVELVMMYLTERLPQLTQDGEKIPPIRKPREA